MDVAIFTVKFLGFLFGVMLMLMVIMRITMYLTRNYRRKQIAEVKRKIRQGTIVSERPIPLDPRNLLFSIEVTRDDGSKYTSPIVLHHTDVKRNLSKLQKGKIINYVTIFPPSEPTFSYWLEPGLVDFSKANTIRPN